MKHLKRDERLQKRAEYEMNVVLACKEKYDDKIANARSDYEDIKTATDIIKEKMISAKKNGETAKMYDYAREAKREDKRLKIKERNMTIFIGTQSVLAQLYDLCDSLREQEYYQVIIKCIPEKKLPKLVRSPKKIKEVFTLVTKLYDDLAKQAQELGKIDEDLRKALDHTDKVDANMKKLYGKDEENLDEYIKAIEEASKQIDDTIYAEDDTQNINKNN